MTDQYFKKDWISKCAPKKHAKGAAPVIMGVDRATGQDHMVLATGHLEDDGSLTVATLTIMTTKSKEKTAKPRIRIRLKRRYEVRLQSLFFDGYTVVATTRWRWLALMHCSCPIPGFLYVTEVWK